MVTHSPLHRILLLELIILPTNIIKGERSTGVSWWLVGLLVKCCVSNSSHSFQVI